MINEKDLIKLIPIVRTPKDYSEVEAWIEIHEPSTRIHLHTASLMTYNLLAVQNNRAVIERNTVIQALLTQLGEYSSNEKVITVGHEYDITELATKYGDVTPINTKPTHISVPVEELEKLEQARNDLYTHLATKLSKQELYALTNITSQIWKVANTIDYL